jgi:hypothetical protein
LNRPRALRLYIVAIGALSAVAIGGATFATVHMSARDLLDKAPYAAVFLALCWWTSQQQVYFGESNNIAMGTIGHMVALTVLPYPLAILVIAPAKCLSELCAFAKRRRTWRQMVVNVGSVVLAGVGGGGSFLLLHGNRLWLEGPQALFGIPGLVALAGLYYLINVVIVFGAISLSGRDGPLTLFRSLVGDLFFPEMSLVLVGLVCAVLFYFSPFLSVLIVVPGLLSARAYEAVARMRKETIQAVLKMAESIDYRDTGTYEHSRRLEDYSRRLAESLGMLREQVNAVVLASQVHDLGKIGISNDILHKQGPLTPNERKIMEDHPVIGANILSSYSAFRGSVDMVRHHHERWDGNGYPDGLAGDDVPLGSRIISVVDAFDAMTSDRPYRRAMSVDAAIERLKDGMDSQFDATVCTAFIRLLKEDGTYVPSQPAPVLHLVTPEATAS